MDPVLFQHFQGFFGLVHAHDDYGLSAFSPAQEGIKIEHVDMGGLQGLEYGLSPPGWSGTSTAMTSVSFTA